MYKIFNECLYHNRQRGKWNQFFILVVFFNDRKYTFNVSVVRYITYSTNKPDEKYISYYRGDNDSVCVDNDNNNQEVDNDRWCKFLSLRPQVLTRFGFWPLKGKLISQVDCTS